MDPVTEADIRSSFINCSKGAAKRLNLPADLADRPWPDLDFLGWSDPAAPGRGYLVSIGDDGPIGVALQHRKGAGRAQMCSICSTTHTGGDVRLMAANKAGEAGRRGNSVGIYMCADFACSLYARRKKSPAIKAYRDDFDPEQRVQQVRDAVAAFINRLQD